MSMKPFVLSRRTVLRGMGASLALPVLDCMMNSHGTALAAGEPLPRRFMTWFFGNGVRLNYWNPTATGAGWALTSELQPLVNVKDYVNVVSGYNIKTPNLRGHHNGAAAILSAIPMIPITLPNVEFASKFGGPSIDQVAAGIIGTGKTTFASLQVGVSKRVMKGEGPTGQYISHKGPDSPVPNEYNPALLYDKLFNNFTPPPANDPSNKVRLSVLDAVREDARRLQLRLGTEDKQRLDAHLTSLGELQTQISALPPPMSATCIKPGRPTQTNVDVSGKEPIIAVNKAMADIIALAFACDLTRVVSFHFTGSVGGWSFPDIGVTQGQHTLSHDSAQQETIHKTVIYTMERLAVLAEALKNTKEGTGNLLDNSSIVVSSDVAEGLPHSINDYPVLVLGRGGGFLKYPGVHHRGRGGNTSDILLTALQAAGTGLTSIGKDTGASSTPVREIMA